MTERHNIQPVEFHPEVELYGPYAIVPVALRCNQAAKVLLKKQSRLLTKSEELFRSLVVLRLQCRF